MRPNILNIGDGKIKKINILINTQPTRASTI